jgi:hypothetical protein
MTVPRGFAQQSRRATSARAAQRPQRPQQRNCFVDALEHNFVDLVIDTGSLLVTIAAPEAKFTQLGLAVAGIAAAGASRDFAGSANGVAGFYTAALDGGFSSKLNNAIRLAGRLSGVYGVYNDLSNIRQETQQCREQGGQ